MDRDHFRAFLDLLWIDFLCFHCLTEFFVGYPPIFISVKLLQTQKLAYYNIEHLQHCNTDTDFYCWLCIDTEIYTNCFNFKLIGACITQCRNCFMMNIIFFKFDTEIYCFTIFDFLMKSWFFNKLQFILLNMLMWYFYLFYSIYNL